MSEPLVSIIIPCFNAEKYVGEAMESALAQTWSNKDVIVIDDGSTDDSLAVIKSFGGRIRWETGSNRGACAARNRGIALAQGEFVQFLDADDLITSNKIQKHIEYLAQRRVDISYSDYEVDACDGESSLKRVSVSDSGDPVEMNLRGGIQTSAPLYSRGLLQTIGGFRSDLPCSQEFDLNLRLACLDTIWGRLGEVLCTIRKVPGGLSRDYAKVLDQYENILLHAYGLLDRAGALSDRRKVAFAETMARAGSHYVQLGEIAKAGRYYALAAGMHTEKGWTQYRPIVRTLHSILGPVVARLFLIRMATALKGFRRRTGGTS